MSSRSGRGARGSRPRRVRVRRADLVAVVTSAIVGVPLVLATDDRAVRAVALGAVALLVLLLVRGSRSVETPVEAFARVLGTASAMQVRLFRVRVAAVHEVRGNTLVTVTWRAAHTVLLDADGRPLAELARNGLTTAYTMSLPVDDAVAVALLRADRGLGDVGVYGTTDLMTHPRGNLRDHGLTIDQYDLDFPSWSGSLPAQRLSTSWEP